MCGLIHHYPFACIREASLHIGRLLYLTFCVSRLGHGTHIFPLSRLSPQTPPRPKRKASYDVVLSDGIPYTTLPWFLGKVPIKSEKNKADACGFTNCVQLKNGIIRSWLDISARSFWGLRRWLHSDNTNGYPRRAHRRERTVGRCSADSSLRVVSHL